MTGGSDLNSPEPWREEETHLGQILRDGAWWDYARGTAESALEWHKQDPEIRRVVDWISADVLIPPGP